MRATIYVNSDDSVTHKPVAVKKAAEMAGMSFPYITKTLGFPLFELEGEKPMRLEDWTPIEAPPGMVGMTHRGELYVIDSDGNAQRVPGHVLNDREHERYIKLKESHRAEAA